MSITLLDPDFDPSKLTEAEIDEAKNNTIVALIHQRNLYEKGYNKVIKLYLMCIVSCYFSPVFIYAFILGFNIRNGDNPYIQNKTILPLVIGGIISTFQFGLLLFLIVQLQSGIPIAGAFAQLILPSLLASILILCFLLLSNLKYRVERKRRDVIFNPGSSTKTKFRTATDGLLTKIIK
ncbi:hypothetical protein BOP93_06920 [Pseudomonas orientalis]|uniref:Uncharacterized protein n=2 Tax=Pseudomonas orientalis TaxID=76758 RepID=A0A2L0RT71_9PSED|nr:hypothetical protein BOP93_06920 [Pseudomonas orientalis]